MAVKSALLGTRHPRKEKEAALQTVTGKPACLDGKILVSTQSEKEPSVKICKIEVRSSQPAGTPIHRASQGLLPGAPDYQVEIFEIWQNFANFATFARFLLNFSQKLLILQTDFLRKF